MSNDTVAAISTAVMGRTTSIIRMSGADTLSIVDSILNLNAGEKKSRTISCGYVYDQEHGELTNEVPVSIFRAPKIFICENTVEISCHGGRSITKKILRLCLAHGARPANPDEFTQRAFLNGRIGLTQTEAVNNVIRADTDEDTRVAVQDIRGNVRKLLEPLIQDLLGIITNIEVNIDYPEYGDVEQLSSNIIQPKAEEWMMRIRQILGHAQSGQLLKEGIKTAIVGKPNVGENSLLNVLLEEEKAIVTDIAGTTHDIVEGHIHLRGLTLNLIGTAGIRDTEDVMKQIGTRRGLQAISEAQLVIVILDSSHTLNAQDEELLELTKDKMCIIVCNKTDTPHRCEGICISVAGGKIEPLMAKVHELFDGHQLVLREPLLQNECQVSLMTKTKSCMRQAPAAMKLRMELDIIVIDVREAYTALKEILREVHREDLLNTLSSNFYLGK